MEISKLQSYIIDVLKTFLLNFIGTLRKIKSSIFLTPKGSYCSIDFTEKTKQQKHLVHLSK